MFFNSKNDLTLTQLWRVQRGLKSTSLVKSQRCHCSANRHCKRRVLDWSARPLHMYHSWIPQKGNHQGNFLFSIFNYC